MLWSIGKLKAGLIADACQPALRIQRELPEEEARLAPQANHQKQQAILDRAPTPAARRALAEAEERRARQKGPPKQLPEIAGRGGLDPVRYGDWEVNGLASDF